MKSYISEKFLMKWQKILEYIFSYLKSRSHKNMDLQVKNVAFRDKKEIQGHPNKYDIQPSTHWHAENKIDALMTMKDEENVYSRWRFFAKSELEIYSF